MLRLFVEVYRLSKFIACRSLSLLNIRTAEHIVGKALVNADTAGKQITRKVQAHRHIPCDGIRRAGSVDHADEGGRACVQAAHGRACGYDVTAVHVDLAVAVKVEGVLTSTPAGNVDKVHLTGEILFRVYVVEMLGCACRIQIDQLCVDQRDRAIAREVSGNVTAVDTVAENIRILRTVQHRQALICTVGEVVIQNLILALTDDERTATRHDGYVRPRPPVVVGMNGEAVGGEVAVSDDAVFTTRSDLNARIEEGSVQEFNVVIVATVGGKIHAVPRDTLLWARIALVAATVKR